MNDLEFERRGVPDGTSLIDGWKVGPFSRFSIVALIGTRWCGVVDHVPNTFYVATLFFHVLWIPLVPLQSWIVVLDLHGSRTAASTPIGWHLVSILAAWFRTLLVLATLALGMSGLGGLIGAFQGDNGVGLPLALLAGGAASAALLWGTFWLGEASPTRSEALAESAGFTPAEADAIASGVRWAAAAEADPGIVCPRCQRELASSTRICPRCEHRLR